MGAIYKSGIKYTDTGDPIDAYTKEESDSRYFSKQNLLNKEYPQGSIYVTYANINPSTFIGGEWELVGGTDADSNYYPAFAIETDTEGATIDESLPNITGMLPMHNQGAIGVDGSALYSTTGSGDTYTVDGANAATTKDKLHLDASRASAVYKDDAKVNVNAIKLFFWRRTDDATLSYAVDPLVIVNTIDERGTVDQCVSAKGVYDYTENFYKKGIVNNLFLKGCVYTTYENKNPSTFLGGTWELIGGEDASKNYYPAFAIATDTAGATIAESLPNITGGWGDQSAGANASFNGAFANSTSYSSRCWGNDANGKTLSINFNASRSNSTYKDGAQVNVNAIKLFFWRRTDDATLALVKNFELVKTIDDTATDEQGVTARAVKTALDSVAPDRNLFKMVKTGVTKDGVTLTINSNGSYKISGTATANTYIDLCANINELFSIFRAESLSTYFVFSITGATYDTTTMNVSMNYNNSSGQTVYLRADSVATTINFGAARTLGCTLYIANGTTVNADNVFLQLERGGKATSYTPYAKSNAELTEMVGTHYSTEEQVVGTYMGETLYQRTFTFDALSAPDAVWAALPNTVQIDNVKTIISGEGMCRTDDYTCSLLFGSGNKTSAGANGVSVFSIGGYQSVDTVTVRYTKN